MQRYLGFIIGILLLSLGKVKAYSFEDTSLLRRSFIDTLPDYQLKEVLIQSRKIHDKELRSPMPVQIMDKESIENLNNLSVADAIRYFSGTQLKDYGGIGGLKTMNVRSMGSHHTTVFYNGMPLGNAQNGQVDLGRISLQNISLIKLYQAQSNNLFQPAQAFASGATLYLETKVPTFKKNNKTNLKASFQTGSFGLLNPSLNWEQKISTNISSSLSTEYTTANGRYPFQYANGSFDTSAIRQNADITAWRMEAGFYGQFPDSSTWRIQAYHYQSKRGLPGAAVSNHFENHQRLWNKDQFIQAKWNKIFNPNYAIKINTKYAYHYTRYLDPFYTNNQGKLENQYQDKSFYASLANQFTITPFWKTVFSVDYHWNKLNADVYHFPFPTRHTIQAVVASKLHFEYFQLQGSLLETYVKDEVEKYTGAGKKTELTPTITTSWQPIRKINIRLRGFYKNIFRMPTFNDLYYTFVGNTKLQPEYIQQWDAGLTYHHLFANKIWKYISFTADVYHNIITDKIIATPGTNLFRWTMSNIGKVDIKGIDFQLDNRFLLAQQFFLKIGLNYTYQEALDVTNKNYQYKNQIPYSPKHSGSAIASIEWKSWHLNYSFIYTGDRYSQTSNIQQYYIPAWYTHDLSINKQWKFKEWGFKLSAEVNNLANQHYDVIQNFPMPGRSYRIGLSIHLL